MRPTKFETVAGCQVGSLHSLAGDMRPELGRNVRSRGIDFGSICMEVIVGIMKVLPGRNKRERNRV